MKHASFSMILMDSWPLWILQGIWIIFACRLYITKKQPPSESSQSDISLSTCCFGVSVAMIWRFAIMFVLISSGYYYAISDDIARWLMSWQWTQSPFLITWDGIWLGGSFYLHGGAMLLFKDPFVASKVMNVFLQILAIISVGFYSWALTHQRAFACFITFLFCSWWLPVLLSTGTLADPVIVIGFTAGMGFLVLARELPYGTSRRYWRLIIAGLLFAFASSLHTSAWIMLFPLVAIVGCETFFNKTYPRRLSIWEWVLFSLFTGIYIIAWITGCWIKFGHPFHSMIANAAANASMLEFRPLYIRMAAYPMGLFTDLGTLTPLMLFGFFILVLSTWRRHADSSQSQPHHEQQRQLIVYAGILILLIASTIKGGTNAQPFRTVMPLAAVLMPLLLAKPWTLLHHANRFKKSWILTSFLTLFIIIWGITNHIQTPQAISTLMDWRSKDGTALGVWLRCELKNPIMLPPNGLSPRVLIGAYEKIPSANTLVATYLTGDSRMAELWHDRFSMDTVEKLSPGQYVFTEEPLDETWMEPLTRIGSYYGYRRRDLPLPPTPIPQEQTKETNPETVTQP